MRERERERERETHRENKENGMNNKLFNCGIARKEEK